MVIDLQLSVERLTEWTTEPMSALESLLENTKSVALAARQERRQVSAEWDAHSASLATALDLEEAEAQASRERADLEFAREVEREGEAEAERERNERRKQEENDAEMAARLGKLDIFQVPTAGSRNESPVGGTQASDGEASDTGAASDEPEEDEYN